MSTLVATAMTVLATSQPAPAAEPARRPNVLFLFADDMRADSVAALGNPHIKTPNLDMLVARGFSFRNAYCFGGNSPAVCTPSRNMMLSGNCYFRWKEFTPPGGRGKGTLSPGDGPNFPSVLNEAGYQTYHHGKKGNTAPLIQARFEIDKTLKNDEAERNSGEPGKEVVDETITFLKDRNDPRPFFLYLAFGNPHDPRVAAKSYLDQYDPAKLPLPKNFLPIHPFDNGELTVRDEKLLSWPRTEVDIRWTHHEYNATVTALDFHIGRLLEAMKSAGLLENTLVIFSADQGIALGSHGLLGKQNLYEHSMKSPLVFAGPGVSHGESSALCYLFDIFPTVCELTGIKPPDSIDGKSLRPVLKGEAKTHRNEMMLAYRDKQRAFRNGRWKLIRYPDNGMTQLFDLENDPDERTNLSEQPEQQVRVQRLLKRLARLQRQFGDNLPLLSAKPEPVAPISPELLKERSEAKSR